MKFVSYCIELKRIGDGLIDCTHQVLALDYIILLQVRLDMAEKRLQSTGKEGDERVVRLQRKVDDLMSDLKKKEA